MIAWNAKAPTDNTELINFLNRFGESVSISKLKEKFTILVIYKCYEDENGSVLLPQYV